MKNIADKIVEKIVENKTRLKELRNLEKGSRVLFSGKTYVVTNVINDRYVDLKLSEIDMILLHGLNRMRYHDNFENCHIYYNIVEGEVFFQEPRKRTIIKNIVLQFNVPEQLLVLDKECPLVFKY